MGKNWKGGKGGGSGTGNDFASCRGYGVVIGTCDAARERETSKELVNMLTQAIEELYPAPEEINKDESDDDGGNFESIQDMLNSELKKVRNQKHSHTQNVLSINTGVKGIVLVKICRKDICPVQLVKAIFDKVKKDRLPCSRHVVRVLPMKLACFPSEEDLNDSLKLMLDASIGLDDAGKCVMQEYLHTGVFKLASHKRKVEQTETAAETDEVGVDQQPEKKTRVESDSLSADDLLVSADAPTSSSSSSLSVEEVAVDAPAAQPVTPVPVPTTTTTSSSSSSAFVPKLLSYTLSFKARNHNTLDKNMLFKACVKHMPAYARNDYRKPEVLVMVEAIKNLCAISLLTHCEDYLDFNLRKFQTLHSQETIKEHPVAAVSAVTVPAAVVAPVDNGDGEIVDNADKDEA